MKVICILQNAWGGRNIPVIFEPNPLNKSAKTIRKICGTTALIFHFSNTTGVSTETAKGKPPIDYEHFEKVIKRLQSYDVILVCGKQAQEAVKKTIDQFKILNKPVIYIPHPASRDLKNVTLEKTNLLLYKLSLDSERKFIELEISNK